MTPGSDILRAALLAGSPALSATVVRPDAAIEGDLYPFIIYRKVNVQRDLGLDSSLHCATETFHVECWGETRADCESLAIEVVNALRAADMTPYEDDPDGLDPTVKVKASIVVVEVYPELDPIPDELSYT